MADSVPEQGGGYSADGIEPMPLVAGQDEVAEYLDKLNEVLKSYKVSPSSFLNGAAFLCNPILRRNPDWVSQSAHSFREVGYLFSGSPVKSKQPGQLTRKQKSAELIREYLEETYAAELASRLTDMTHIFANISHHHSERKGDESDALKKLISLGIAPTGATTITTDIFIALAKEFIRTIASITSEQLTIHQQVDTFCKDWDNRKDASVRLGLLLASNRDTRAYFYSRANESQLHWLNENGFLDVIKQKSGDPTHYAYQTPELDYLVRTSETLPAEVTNIMLSVDVPNSFNPEVVDRFVWICSKLPAEQLARIAPKIRDERWIPLMSGFNRWGFEYKNMFEKLSSEKDVETIIALAAAVLSIKPQIKNTDSKMAWRTDSPFYFDQVSDTGVFEHLTALTDAGAENALKLASETLGGIAAQGNAGSDEVFKLDDSFHLFDVDFFSLSVEQGRHLSARDDVKSLAAVVKTLTERLIGGSCEDGGNVRRLYDEAIALLPDSRSMWRLRLFVWSLCPHVFQDELIAAFDRAFAYENNWPIVSGAEYEWAIKKSFGKLSEEYRLSYIKRIFEYYEAKEIDLRGSGYDILSCIPEPLLTPDDKKRAEVLFGKALNPGHEPEPTIRSSYAGMVVPQPVVAEEEFGSLAIEKIVAELKNEWSPDVLRSEDKERDYLRPRNAEGMANLLQADMKKRLGEYIQNAPLFFERATLDSHYTYAFVRGMCDAYKTTELPAETDWHPLMELLSNMIQSARQESFAHGPRDRRGVDGWLAGWDAVHSAMADLVKILLGEDGGDKAIPFETYRDQLLSVIEYLLKYPDPEPEQHDNKATKHPTTGKDQYNTSDPFTTAINSARGRAFQAFTLFVYRDGELLKVTNGADVLSYKTKEIYEYTLVHEKTEAVMFMFGHYLATFYYRDQEFIKHLLPLIFQKENRDLFLAAWEGYLASNLYGELLEELTLWYEYAIDIDPDQYTPRRYFSEIDDALAGHIALAYMHFPNFTTDSPLFKKFWSTKSNKRHEEFASFIGRHAVSRDGAVTWNIEHKIDMKKLVVLWDWLLENCNEPSVFAEFGFWVNTKEAVFEEKWLAAHLRQTLEKSGGKLDWDYGLMQSLPTLATASPEDTVAILRSYLTVAEIGVQYRAWVHIDETMIGVFKTLYGNPVTKDATYALINELLPRGSGQFWRLKEALS